MNKQRIIFLSLTVLFFSIAAHAQTIGADTSDQIGGSLSLQQAVSIAIKHNLLVNQADIQAQVGKVNYNQAWEYMLPTLNGQINEAYLSGRNLNTTSYQYVNTSQVAGSYGLSTNLTLFNGLQLQNGIKQYRYAYDASKMDLQQQKNNITLNVLLAYLQILSSRDLLAIAKEQANVDSIQMVRLDTLNQSGALLLLSNLTDLKGQYAGDLANIAAAANNLEIAKINLFNILNVPYNRTVEYDQSAFTLQVAEYNDDPDGIYKRSLETMPSVKAAQLRVNSYQKALLAAKGAYYPQLTFYGSVNSNWSDQNLTGVPSNISSDTTGYVNVTGTKYYTFADHQQYDYHKIPFWDQVKNNRNQQFGVQLNIPILNYLRVRNNVRQARLNLKNQQLISENTRVVLQQNVETAYQNMITAYKQYKSYIEQAAAYAVQRAGLDPVDHLRGYALEFQACRERRQVARGTFKKRWS